MRWVAAGEIIELVDIILKLGETVHLVDREHDRLLCAAQHIGDAVVGVGDTGADIGEEDDYIRCLNGNLRLFPHRHQQFIPGFRLDTAGVNQCEVAV